MPEDQITNLSLYSILIDVQKQIGGLSRQTGEVTEKLVSIEKQLPPIVIRVEKVETSINALELINANHNGRTTVETAIWSAVAGVILTVAATVISKHIGL